MLFYNIVSQEWDSPESLCRHLILLYTIVIQEGAFKADLSMKVFKEVGKHLMFFYTIVSQEWVLTDGQVVFLRVLRFSPTFDERSARYKWNILERAVKPKSKKKKKKKKSQEWDSLESLCRHLILLYTIVIQEGDFKADLPLKVFEEVGKHPMFLCTVVFSGMRLWRGLSLESLCRQLTLRYTIVLQEGDFEGDLPWKSL